MPEPGEPDDREYRRAERHVVYETERSSPKAMAATFAIIIIIAIVLIAWVAMQLW